MTDNGAAHRGRVYVRRRGRMTAGQARALAQVADPYRLEHAALCEFAQAQLGQAPIGLEIGFGMGQAMVEWCQQAPDWQILGIEVYQPGIGSAMLHAEELSIGNLRIFDGDAAALLEQTPALPWLQEVRIFFPDPWPKKRHHKRRLIQTEFIALVSERLCAGGVLRVATDWEAYAEHINHVLSEAALLRNLGSSDGYAPRFAKRGTTRFEARGARLGHSTWDFFYERVQTS
ncbi:MAG: tRNA (guanosine(46)-N7)-methyltransferase TrmB [Pseudomonadales bacterium]